MFGSDFDINLVTGTSPNPTAANDNNKDDTMRIL